MNEDDRRPQSAVAATPKRLLAVVFPVALWLMATFYLLGDAGLYLDDWYYLQREPETGAIQALFFDRPHLNNWRPLYRVVVPALTTLLWQVDWLNHFIGALAHGGVVVLLWRLALMLGVPRMGAAVGSLIFLVWPAYFEAIFWICSLPTILSAGAVIVAWMTLVKYARREAGGWAVAAIPALFFASASLNEQAACGVAMLPFLYLAARSKQESFGASVRRMAAPVVLSVLALAVYAYVHVKMRYVPPGVPRESFLPTAEQLLSHWRLTRHWFKVQFVSPDFLGRALEVGWQTLRDYPVRSVAFAITMLLGLPAWAMSMAKPESRAPSAPGWLFVLGVVAFVAPMMPILILTYYLGSRLTYAPALSVVFLVGAVSAFIERVSRVGFGGRVLTAACLGVPLVVPAIMMVGFQRGFHNRTLQDNKEIANLRELVPDPPRDAVFVPLWIDGPPVPRDTDACRFDVFYFSPFNAWVSARWFVRMEYGRSDLRSCHYRWGERVIPAITPTHAVVGMDGFEEVSLDLLVPFVIDDAGSVQLVTEIVADGVKISVPQTARIARERGLESLSFTYTPDYVHLPRKPVSLLPRPQN